MIQKQILLRNSSGVFDLKHTQPLLWEVFRVIREGKLLPSLVEYAHENLSIGKVSLSILWDIVVQHQVDHLSNCPDAFSCGPDEHLAFFSYHSITLS